jgi:ElaB/YqjD/DUF883 family membrane-anchored ribosome-binding protein
MADSPSNQFGGGDTPSEAREHAKDAKDDLAQLRADLAKLADTEAGLVSNKASAAKSSVRDTASDLYSRGQEALQQAGEKAKEKTDELSHTIEQNPITAVLAAFGLGMLFGMMSRHR